MFKYLFCGTFFCGAIVSLGSAHAQTPAPPPVDTSSYIRTPSAPSTPRINGADVYGERPSHPFLYHLPVTGDRPITYSAENLPDGLTLDGATGNITGSVKQAGTFPVKFTAKNAQGQDSKTISLVIGSTICLTPPMGWNSWNCFGPRIDAGKIRSAADAMVKSGLIDHGWTYINMDDKWEGVRSPEGKIQGSENFPDMKGMADYIHGLGLKVGLYSSPGPYTCAGAPGSYEHEDQDAQTYAEWGMDYLKYDWCSYDGVIHTRRAEKFAEALPDFAANIKDLAAQMSVLKEKYRLTPNTNKPDIIQQRKDLENQMKDINGKLEALYGHLDAHRGGAITLAEQQAPYRLMRASLNKVNRDIVYSFCQYGMGGVQTWGADAGGNTWRVTGDIRAIWPSVEAHGFKLKPGLAQWANPGHWNDPDMLEVGNGDLTPDENYTHMTLWCMLTAPLLIGCDMTRMTPFTISLFSNDEVLAVNQDRLGKQGDRVKQDGTSEVWTKPLADGALAVAFFNRGEVAADISVSWSELGLNGKQSVRDLWREKDLGTADTSYSVNVARHGAELFKISPAK